MIFPVIQTVWKLIGNTPAKQGELKADESREVL